MNILPLACLTRFDLEIEPLDFPENYRAKCALLARFFARNRLPICL
jgi:hypothetical protein